MASQSGKRKAESQSSRELRVSSVELCASSPTRAFRAGMTLIELLVSIVILVTVLAAVIPVLSPNNDARRIRSGARQLQSMLAQAQAMAAREGRPFGVAFKEAGVDSDGDDKFDTGNGTALEVYYISEPKPYAGFSEFSRVRLFPRGNQPGDPVDMQFVLAGIPTGTAFPQDLVEDLFPPYVIRRGDRINVNGVIYRLIDLDRDGDGNELTEEEFPYGDFYELKNPQPGKLWRCVPEAPRPPLPVHMGGAGGPVATTPQSYQLLRQTSNPAERFGPPTVTSETPNTVRRPSNSMAPPLQFPRGVAIDLVASGLDVIFPDATLALSPQYGFTSRQSPMQTALRNNGDFYPFVRPLTVGVLFAPSGRLEQIWINGEKLQGDPDRVYFLVGRSENSLRSGEDKAADADFNTVANDRDGDDEVLARRDRLNWLNGDSLWVTVGSRTGRIVTADNDISTDPRAQTDGSTTVEVQTARQIRDARQSARTMSSEARQ